MIGQTLAAGRLGRHAARLWSGLGTERREVLRGSLAGIVMRMVDVPARYGFHYLMALKLGVYQAGLFYLAFSALNLLCGFGRVGLDYAMTRDIAAGQATGNVTLLGRIARKGFGLVFALSLVTTLACLAFAHPLAEYVFEQPKLSVPFRLLALTILPVNLFVAAAGVLAGLKQVVRSQLLYGPLWPALWCLAALCFDFTIKGAIDLLIGAQLTTAVVGIILMTRALPRGALSRSDPADRQPVRLFGLGWSLFMAETVQLLISTAPILLLGHFEQPDAVGLFAIANRLTMIVTVVVYGVASIASSKFAELNRLGDRERLTQTVRMVALVVIVLTVPLLAIMVAVPEFVMGLVGQAFREGAPLMRILAVGYIFSALFAAMPILLGMSGHERDLRNINYVALACLLLSGLTLIPFWGSNGAALATAITVVLNSLLSAYAVHRRLGINPLLLFGAKRS